MLRGLSRARPGRLGSLSALLGALLLLAEVGVVHLAERAEAQFRDCVTFGAGHDYALGYDGGVTIPSTDVSFHLIWTSNSLGYSGFGWDAFGPAGWDIDFFVEQEATDPDVGLGPFPLPSLGTHGPLAADEWIVEVQVCAEAPHGAILVHKTGGSSPVGFGVAWPDIGQTSFNVTPGGYSFHQWPPGMLRIWENVPTGWRQIDSYCIRDGDQATRFDNPEEFFELHNREVIDCYFTNERVQDAPGRIVVKKVASPLDAPAGSFEFNPSWSAGNFSLASSGSADSGPLPAGVYSVAEVLPLPAGWSPASAVCDDGSNPGAIGVSPGETVTCTFTNSYEEISPPLCFGVPATIVGTAGADTLAGTPAADVIAGLGGNDTINGLGGDDRICGGAGADLLIGGGGNDRIRGGGGADILRGTLGDDRLAGGVGTDLANGGRGTDTCLAETTTACE